MNHMENKDLYSVKMRASRAMLLNADTLERLEPDVTQNVRICQNHLRKGAGKSGRRENLFVSWE